ncbi:MAG: HD domain-containing protein [Treponema sp.]|nr:HD domain-containing protein [Treponema sp.]
MTTEEMIRLRETRLAPYIQLATALIGKTRSGGGNMFRHQLDTMAILVDYGYIDSVLLKASIVHDVLEDIPDFNHNTFFSLDYESHQVYELVREVTRNPDETKPEFLTRVFESGSRYAKILKVADRISNMISLGFVVNMDFVSRYTDETERFIFPIARDVDASMLKELQSLVESRRRFFNDYVNARSGGLLFAEVKSHPA